MKNSNLFFNSDISTEILDNKNIVIIGYGNQGRAQALNLRDSGFNVILGIPSNSFMQEHSSEEKVKDFCETNFNITFPMTKIVNVIGTGRHPLYSWLNDAFEIKPKWNFYKILIDRNGNFVDAFSSLTKPNSPKLIKIIEDKIKG